MLATWGCATFPKPTLDLQFEGATSLDSRITFTRGSQATLFNSAGTLVFAPNNVIRNNTMVGAVAGTPGTAPTNWFLYTALTGLTTEIVGTGADSGITYIDIRISGTPSAAGSYAIGFDSNTGIAALNGQTWAESAYLKLQAGSFTGITATRLQNDERSASAYIRTNASSPFTVTSAALNTQRFSFASTLSGGATVAFIVPYILLSLSGAAIDITLRIGMPQLERGSVATAVNATSGTAYYGPRFDYDPSTLAARGLLIEEARTNSIRNNTMQGAVAGIIGSGGALPTNFSTFTSLTGLAREIVSVGTENGIPYIDFRLSGTPSGSGSLNLFFDSTVAAASQNQQWTNSSYVKLVGGSLGGVTSLQQVIIEYNSGSGFLTQGASSFTPEPSGSLNVLRVAYTRTLTNALTAFTRASYQYNLSGAAIDITLRIGLPQLELGAFATSVIPTTTTALTRNVDVASMTGTNFSSWYNAVEGTVITQSLATRQISTAGTGLASMDDGTISNMIRNFVSATAFGRFGVFNSGATQADLTPGSAITANTILKLANTYALNNFASVSNGSAAQTDTSGTVPTVNRMTIGYDLNGVYLNGYIQRISYYPVRLSNAQLQALTS